MTVLDIAVIRKDGLDYPVFVDGDFSLQPSDQQHIQDIFEAFQGWYKEFPILGVGISAYVKSSGKEQEIQTNGSIMLRSDGYQVPNVDVTYNKDGTLNIITNAARS